VFFFVEVGTNFDVRRELHLAGCVSVSRNIETASGCRKDSALKRNLHITHVSLKQKTKLILIMCDKTILMVQAKNTRREFPSYVIFLSVRVFRLYYFIFYVGCCDQKIKFCTKTCYLPSLYGD
jgi:hypothetical protein